MFLIRQKRSELRRAWVARPVLSIDVCPRSDEGRQASAVPADRSVAQRSESLPIERARRCSLLVSR